MNKYLAREINKLQDSIDKSNKISKGMAISMMIEVEFAERIVEVVKETFEEVPENPLLSQIFSSGEWDVLRDIMVFLKDCAYIGKETQIEVLSNILERYPRPRSGMEAKSAQQLAEVIIAAGTMQPGDPVCVALEALVKRAQRLEPDHDETED